MSADSLEKNRIRSTAAPQHQQNQQRGNAKSTPNPTPLPSNESSFLYQRLPVSEAPLGRAFEVAFTAFQAVAHADPLPPWSCSNGLGEAPVAALEVEGFFAAIKGVCGNLPMKPGAMGIGGGKHSSANSKFFDQSNKKPSLTRG
ncbi:MAG: hypothetical protein NTZ40_02015 [Cyanobacteria bacterium]|nr:hypothetical protein [Cyanobacteriota bacterium]